jgi:hypothetical protein
MKVTSIAIWPWKDGTVDLTVTDENGKGHTITNTDQVIVTGRWSHFTIGDNFEVLTPDPQKSWEKVLVAWASEAPVPAEILGMESMSDPADYDPDANTIAYLESLNLMSYQ